MPRCRDTSRRARASGRHANIARPRDVGTKLLRGDPGPVRVFQHGAAKRDHVGLAARDNLLACFGVAIKPTTLVAMPVSRLICSAIGTL